VSGLSLLIKDSHNAPSGFGVHTFKKTLRCKILTNLYKASPHIYICSVQQQFDFDFGF